MCTGAQGNWVVWAGQEQHRAPNCMDRRTSGVSQASGHTWWPARRAQEPALCLRTPSSPGPAAGLVKSLEEACLTAV